MNAHALELRIRINLAQSLKKSFKLLGLRCLNKGAIEFLKA